MSEGGGRWGDVTLKSTTAKGKSVAVVNTGENKRNKTRQILQTGLDAGKGEGRGGGMRPRKKHNGGVLEYTVGSSVRKRMPREGGECVCVSVCGCE